MGVLLYGLVRAALNPVGSLRHANADGRSSNLVGLLKAEGGKAIVIVAFLQSESDISKIFWSRFTYCSHAQRFP